MRYEICVRYIKDTNVVFFFFLLPYFTVNEHFQHEKRVVVSEEYKN